MAHNKLNDKIKREDTHTRAKINAPRTTQKIHRRMGKFRDRRNEERDRERESVQIMNENVCGVFQKYCG